MSGHSGALSLKKPGTFKPFKGFGDLVLHEDARYWHRGISRVPEITGAAPVMDCRDLIDACARLNVELPLKGRVLDIGCGTGRFQRFCQAYIGLDISPSAVAYVLKKGIYAHLIEGYGPAALDGWLGGSEWVVCFSVFTHIGAEERHDYLESFYRIANNLLVDIIPGDGSGDIVKWTADVPAFEADLLATGWRVQTVGERISPDGVCHRYYRADHL